MVDGPYSMTQITEMFGQDLPVRRFRVRQDSLKITKSQELVKFNTFFFFPSNAFMASARSLPTFNRGKQLNCNLHAGLSTCREPQKCW